MNYLAIYATVLKEDRDACVADTIKANNSYYTSYSSLVQKAGYYASWVCMTKRLIAAVIVRGVRSKLEGYSSSPTSLTSMPGTFCWALPICRGGKTQNTPVAQSSRVGEGAQPKAAKEKRSLQRLCPRKFWKLEGKSCILSTFAIVSRKIMVLHFMCGGQTMPSYTSCTSYAMAQVSGVRGHGTDLIKMGMALT